MIDQKKFFFLQITIKMNERDQENENSILDINVDEGVDINTISCSSKGANKRELSDGEYTEDEDDDSHSDNSGKRRRSDFNRNTRTLNYLPSNSKNEGSGN